MTAAPRRVYVASADILCKQNSILSSHLIKHFSENGLVITDVMADADLIIVNTCGFDDEHEEICRDLYGSALEGRSPDARVVSVGCLNAINRGLIEEQFPEVTIVDDDEGFDAIVGAGRPLRETRGRYMDGESMAAVADQGGSFPLRGRAAIRFGELAAGAFGVVRRAAVDAAHIEQIIDEVNHRNKFYVEIGSGCIGTCAYCIIKKAKGAPRSRPADAIIEDIRRGRREGQVINLVADDCASYGVDIGTDLFTVVDRIGAELPGVPSDFCYLNPYWLDRDPERYLDMIRKHRINSMNVSLQSGAQRVVEAMDRRYDVAKVLRLIEQIREISPTTMIWAHFLLGYPTETWREYWATVRASRSFDFFYGFAYSPREGTRSAELARNVPSGVRRLRKTLLFALHGRRMLTKLAFGTEAKERV